MQRLEVSDGVLPLLGSLGSKRLMAIKQTWCRTYHVYPVCWLSAICQTTDNAWRNTGTVYWPLSANWELYHKILTMSNQQNNNEIRGSHDDEDGKNFLWFKTCIFRPALEAGSYQNVNKYMEHTRRHVLEDDKHEHYTVHSATQLRTATVPLPVYNPSHPAHDWRHFALALQRFALSRVRNVRNR